MIRSCLVFGVAVLLGIIIQATLIHSISPYAIAPDFIVVLAVYLGLFVQNPAGAVGAFCLGVIGDFASGQFLGPTAAGAVIAFGLTVLVSRKIYAEHPITLVLLAAVCSVADSVTYLLIVKTYVRTELFTYEVLRGIGIEALLTGLIAPIVVRALKWGTSAQSHTERYTGRERARWA